ncbi:hypothetical protein Daesc_005480 [Daldinia eschscholtzii]|uniref:Ankyrin n=1 Tax=Daldinia eschscholtzii TaxID=292717 RepID=A0AAX6MKJ3_9PEZI
MGQDGHATLPTDVILRTPSPAASISPLPSMTSRQLATPSFQVPVPSPTTQSIAPATDLPTSTTRDTKNALRDVPWAGFNHRMLLFRLFRQELPILRKFWEHLAECAGRSGHHDTFTSLMEVGLQHDKWIRPKGALYLSFAASMNALNVVRILLNLGVRADGVLGTQETPAIIEAAIADNTECVWSLLETCDVNKRIFNPWTKTRMTSNFQLVLSILTNGTFAKRSNPYFSNIFKETGSKRLTAANLRHENEAGSRILKMFLDRGANVDLPWALPTFRYLYSFSETWYPTILEQIYYSDESLFRKLTQHSSGVIGRISRQKICTLAKGGRGALREYFALRPAMSDFDRKTFLELILLEQFLKAIDPNMKDVRIDLDVVQGLLEFGVDPNCCSLWPYGLSSHELDASDLLLLLLISRPHVNYLNKAFETVLRLILKSGVVICPDIVEASVEKIGINILTTLGRFRADVGRVGAAALSAAARLGNYKAVSWLLDSGVDINAVVPSNPPQTVIAAACSPTGFYPYRWHGLPFTQRPSHGPASYNMLVSLVVGGVALKNHPSDPNAFQFMYHFLRGYEVTNDSLFKIVKLFLSKLSPQDLVDPDDPSKCLLEACLNLPAGDHNNGEQTKMLRERIAVCELLLKHGVPVQDNRALSHLIYHRGSSELVGRLLQSCVNINAYFQWDNEPYFKGSIVQLAAYCGKKALVEDLLRQGADINQAAAIGGGRTALQAACDWEMVQEGEEAERIDLIQFLIAKGADINAPDGTPRRFTSLQRAAARGNVEVLLLLLREGADVNKYSRHESALDVAAYYGRLDAVHLLLDVGGLSAAWGLNGFAGAISSAEAEGHFSVARLIRRHAEGKFRPMSY